MAIVTKGVQLPKDWIFDTEGRNSRWLKVCFGKKSELYSFNAKYMYFCRKI